MYYNCVYTYCMCIYVYIYIHIFTHCVSADSGEVITVIAII